MTTTRMKGSIVAVRNIGARVEIWFSSPTGDSSDSHIFEMPCLNEAQAEEIVAHYKSIWKGLADY